MVMYSIVLWVIFARIIHIFITIESVLFDAPFFILFVYLPFLFGKKLFINKSPCQGKENEVEKRDG